MYNFRGLYLLLFLVKYACLIHNKKTYGVHIKDQLLNKW
jgi:hypothetical protein